ncbi:cation/H(+) antiporter 14-like [Benincasa hispida]|uniref:cation/H(+) antiporter 14-like n=1 Tax=Benincasa hispida TaxID=102211 RepID=UPI0019016F61|nr:cation/H(+) antiporter 14-like [Benincasa hispida]
MGSIVMKPDDIATFVSGRAGRSFNNSTNICTFARRIRFAGVFMGENPLVFSISLLLLQVGIYVGTILLFYRLFKPPSQPLIVSQILGDLILGSSVMVHLEAFR